MVQIKEDHAIIINPLWLRTCHWINAFSTFIMIFSGWRIYNASPLFDFYFPDELTLGGWLGGALQWHFAGMWLFGINGIIYFGMNLACRRYYRFLPLNISALIRDVKKAICGRLNHNEIHQYNMIQKFLYIIVMMNCILLVLSGLVMWKSVQFPVLRELLGGYEMSRYLHFFSMSFICCFVVMHLVMVVLVPKSLRAMISGR